MPVISYPEEQRAYGDLFQGRHYIKARDDGSPRCVACMMCATVCPAVHYDCGGRVSSTRNRKRDPNLSPSTGCAV
jgi:formate hydrogenlyase subunit 6/NADH:ubiquinone oxidoreductase subunit I